MTTDFEDVSRWVILVVEDDPDNTAVAEQILAFHGARVVRAEDGADGLKALSDLIPTVILLDLAMPVMDGWQMFKALKENLSLASLPVIAVTAHAMPESREQAITAGFDGYITKPYAVRTFVQEIRNCLVAHAGKRSLKDKPTDE